jgi:hypothetical protein
VVTTGADLTQSIGALAEDTITTVSKLIRDESNLPGKIIVGTGDRVKEIGVGAVAGFDNFVDELTPIDVVGTVTGERIKIVTDYAGGKLDAVSQDLADGIDHTLEAATDGARTAASAISEVHQFAKEIGKGLKGEVYTTDKFHDDVKIVKEALRTASGTLISESWSWASGLASWTKKQSAEDWADKLKVAAEAVPVISRTAAQTITEPIKEGIETLNLDKNTVGDLLKSVREGLVGESPLDDGIGAISSLRKAIIGDEPKAMIDAFGKAREIDFTQIALILAAFGVFVIFCDVIARRCRARD